MHTIGRLVAAACLLLLELDDTSLFGRDGLVGGLVASCWTQAPKLCFLAKSSCLSHRVMFRVASTFKHTPGCSKSMIPRISSSNTSHTSLRTDNNVDLGQRSVLSRKLSFLEGSRLYEDSDFYDLSVWKTPLWMITHEPDLNNLVQYLQELRVEILGAPQESHLILFSRAKIEAARAAFSRMVRRGEMRLHRLCELTADEILGGNYSRLSVVVGQRPTRDQQRFQLVQPLSADELYANTDLDLGSRQLERFMWQSPDGWQRAALVANFVEYQAMDVNRWGVYKCISRIKAEEEIWNKVVDEIFEVDQMVKREKELRHLSRFVKDVFGIKIVVGDDAQASRVQEHLQRLFFSERSLASHQVPVREDTRSIRFVEVKNYLGPVAAAAAKPNGSEAAPPAGGMSKSSGWRALKSVVQWWDTTIEIQIQVLRNYHRERERITKESHSEFKARREGLRDVIAQGIPLFGFYRDLLHWLFKTTAANPDAPPPAFNNVRVELHD
mmetsp:Transcript_14851/g.40643  ORF Transcript_14851/g.40643 Transcript_14851/m.40643 type:complete len:497 (+) Transcript_14851:51-1541(+)